MTPEQIELERKAFEAWARGQGIEIELWMPSQPQCGYQNVRTNDYWAGWLARAEKAQRVREALERLLKSFPTDTDMLEAGWEREAVDEACNAYDAARTALKD